MKKLFINKKINRQLTGGTIEITNVTANVTANKSGVTTYKAGQTIGKIYTYPTIYAGINLHICYMSDGIKTVLM